MIAIWKDLVLTWQIGAAGIDQINARQTILRRDFLGAQMFFDRHREISAALYGRVIGDDHAFASRDAPYSRDHPRAGDPPVIHAMGRELADFEKRRKRIDQRRNALARKHFAARQMSRARFLAAAIAQHP